MQTRFIPDVEMDQRMMAGVVVGGRGPSLSVLFIPGTLLDLTEKPAPSRNFFYYPPPPFTVTDDSAAFVLSREQGPSRCDFMVPGTYEPASGGE